MIVVIIGNEHNGRFGIVSTNAVEQCDRMVRNSIVCGDVNSTTHNEALKI